MFLQKPNLKILALIGLTLTLACSSEDDRTNEDTEAMLTSEQALLNAQAQIITDQAFNLIELAYSGKEEGTSRSGIIFSSCAVITEEYDGTNTQITLDFGDGCRLNNGHVVSGIIFLDYGPITDGTRTINYQFQSFTHNDNGVAGGGTILRVHNNSNGNPQSTGTKNLVVTFPSGITADVNATRLAEWIEGFASGTWQDHVFLMGGNRDIDFSNGQIHQVEVLDALQPEASWDHFVSGNMEVTRKLGSGIIDFGAGDCDNLATLTIGDQEFTIILD